MYRLVSRPSTRGPLDDLPREWQQARVNELYTMARYILAVAAQDPHRPSLSYEVPYPLGSRLVTVSLVQVLKLGPPDLSVAHLIDLKNPPCLPAWICDGNGKNVLVYTLAELAQELARQPQCYGPTQLGPWYGDSADPWPYEWDPGKGLFAPSPYGTYAPGGPQAVFTRRPLVYHGRAVSIGAIFLLEDPFNDETLLSEKKVIKVPSHAQPMEHAPTGWWFMNQTLLEDYARCYEAGDVTPWLAAHEPVMSSDDPVATPHQTSGRKDDYPEKEPFKVECYRSYFELLEKSRRRKRPSMPMVAKNMKPDISDGTLRKNLKKWGIPYPPTAPSDCTPDGAPPTTPHQ